VVTALPERDGARAATGEQAVVLRLLGPVDLSDGEQALVVGPPQRQAVLAALAVDADAPVPVELLMHRVWGGQPPDGARAALHAHITRLRRVLSQSGSAPARLGRRSYGYVLEMDRDQVDVHRFQRLLGLTRAPECGDEQRLRLLREVLDLWRGAPLAGVASGWATRVRSGLEPKLISAAVAWANAELRFGDPEAVIDRVWQLTALYPLSEPLAGLLMRTLCAVGRPAEALQCYVSTRNHLREELGTDPGPELRDLHTAILRGELEPPSADPPPRLTVASRNGSDTYRPRQLPAATAAFTGRELELATLEAAFAAAARSGSTAVVAINGPGGVGKSALALRAAHRLLDGFPDGQLYLDLRGGQRPGAAGRRPPDQAGLLGRVLGGLSVADADRPREPEAAAALLRTVTADLRLLVVLDNAVTAAQVRPALPAGPGCGVLVTSRRALVELDGAAQLHLGGLPEPAAVRLLRHVIGPARVAAEPDAAAEVARWCGYLPLALRAAGARLAARPDWPIKALAQRLADQRRRLDELDHAEFSVRGSLAASCQELAGSPDPTDRTAAIIVGWLGGWQRSEFSGEEVAGSLGRRVPETEVLLDRLVDVRLLDSPAPGRYRVPPLLRSYAMELPPPPVATSGMIRG
jgi:DNA-binding SARP family transcriptional activator